MERNKGYLVMALCLVIFFSACRGTKQEDSVWKIVDVDFKNGNSLPNDGDFEVMTAYTPVHSYAHTLTYRVQIDTNLWSQFFAKKEVRDFGPHYRQAGFDVHPTKEESLIAFQRRLEAGEGPFFIDGAETIAKPIGDPLTVFVES